MDLISIIVPVYNVENYIQECVDSILSQTYKEYELILIDDGSTDNSGKTCDDYAAYDSRIIVVHQANAGQAAARNKGVSIAKGQWICFVDADDMIHPQMLELLYCAVNTYNVNMSISCAGRHQQPPSGFFNFKTSPVYSKKVIEESFLIELYHRPKFCYGVVWGKLIHKSIVEKVPFVNGRLYEDNAIMMKWFYESEQCVEVDAELYFYRLNMEGTLKSPFSIKKLDVLWSIQEQIDFFESINFNQMKKIAQKQFLLSGAEVYQKTRDLQGAEKYAKKIKKEILSRLKKEYKHLDLNKSQIHYILKLLYPKTMGAILRIVSLEQKYIKRG